MASLPVPLNDLESHFCCLLAFCLWYLMKHRTNLLTWRITWSLFSGWVSCSYSCAAVFKGLSGSCRVTCCVKALKTIGRWFVGSLTPASVIRTLLNNIVAIHPKPSAECKPKPIVRKWSCGCVYLGTTVICNTAQNTSDDLLSYPPDNRHSFTHWKRRSEKMVSAREIIDTHIWAGAMGSRGSVDPPPHFFRCGVHISWCMNAADNTFKLSDQWICDRKCH